MAPRPTRPLPRHLSLLCGIAGVIELLLATHAGSVAPAVTAAAMASFLAAGAALILGRDDNGSGPGGRRRVPVRIRYDDR